MSEVEEVKGQSEDQASEFSISDEGVPSVSDRDLLEAFGFKDEIEDEPAKEPVQDNPPPAATPEPPVEPPVTSKRKIKYQGQDVEVEPDKEVELLQKGFDYTQKMQALANERELLTPHIGIIKAMQSDPTLQRIVAEHLSGKKPEVKEPEKPTFDDPIAELKWEMRQEVMREVEEKYMKPMKAQTTQMTHQQALNQVRMQAQSDPDFQTIQQGIISNLQHVAETVGPDAANSLMKQLDQDPAAYMKAFTTMKARIEKNKTTTKPPESKPLPEPVRKTEHAPLLEGGGNSTSETETRAADKRNKELNRKARAGDMKALGELLLSGGMMKGIID